MAKLTVKYTKYSRYAPMMSYEIEVNGNEFNKGQMSTYNVVDGVQEGLNRLLASLDGAGVESEAITVAGVVLNAATQQHLTDKYTNNKQAASLTFV